MDQDLVSKFKDKYETLAGSVHLAETEDAAADVVLKILKDAQGQRIALGSLPDSLIQPIEAACAAAGIAVLKPPFDNREMPQAIDAAQVGVTWAAFAVAESGSLVEFATDVAFFMDLYANYNAPELGMAAIKLLEALGCEVVIPRQKSCGYPYIGYGDLKKARQVAAENVRYLAPYVEKGYEIVSTEPTATYCLKVSYPRLMDNHPQAVSVAEHSHEFFELVELLEAKRSENLEALALSSLPASQPYSFLAYPLFLILTPETRHLTPLFILYIFNLYLFLMS